MFCELPMWPAAWHANRSAPSEADGWEGTWGVEMPERGPTSFAAERRQPVCSFALRQGPLPFDRCRGRGRQLHHRADEPAGLAVESTAIRVLREDIPERRVN